MKSCAYVSLMILALARTDALLSADGPILEGPQTEIDAIYSVLERWGRARDAGDIDGVVCVHHADAWIMTRDRAVLRGHTGVRSFYAQHYGQGSERRQYGSLTELRVFGDVAILIGRFLVIDESKDIVDPGNYLIVLRKDQSDAWRIYRDIDTPSPDGLNLRPAE